MIDLSLFYDVVHAVGRSLDRTGVIREIVSQSIRIIACRASILRSFDIATNRLEVEAIAGEIASELPALAPLDLTLDEDQAGVAGEAVRTARAVVIQDARGDRRAAAYQSRGAPCANIIAVPLIHRNHVLGTLELLDRRAPGGGDGSGHFSEDDIQLLSILAQSAAEAYSKADLYAEIEAMALTFQRKNQELTILSHISREILGSTSVDDILYIILTGITSGHGLGYNRAVAFFLDQEARELYGAFGIGPTVDAVNRVWSEAPERFRTLGDYFESIDPESIAHSPFNELILKIRLPIEKNGSIFSRVVAESRGFNVRSTESLRGVDRGFTDIIRSSAFAVVPVCARELVIGAIAVDNCFTRKPIQDEDLVLLQTIANQCGLALDAARVVNELSMAMKKLEVATGKLIEAERFATIGEVAAVVAHDIRNPLTAIGGFTRRLAKRLPPDDLGQSYVEIIAKEVSRLEKLASEVLELASTRQIHPTDVELTGFLTYWKESRAQALRARNITMTIEAAPLTMKADARVLDRALTNLLNNAFDAVQDGGHIITRITRADSAACIEIEDDGCGMEAGDVEKAFDPFFTTKTEGTGLGMALAQKAITAHSGAIHIESEKGKGTAVRIVLPLT